METHIPIDLLEITHTHTVQANARKQFTFYGCINVCEIENVCDFLHALIRCVKIITSIERKSLAIDHIFARGVQLSFVIYNVLLSSF